MTEAHTSKRGVGGRWLMIVPAFNESGSVGDLVRELAGLHPDADVVVIDDGSTDATARCVPECATLIRLPFNLGIGGAMQTGYRYALLHGYDAAVQVDADGQHLPSEVGRLVEHLRQSDADVVIGSRFLETVEYRQTAARMAGIRLLKFWLKLLTGQMISDCTSGFRAVNRKVLAAFAHWYPDDYPEPEVILLLHRAGFRIEEIQVRMNERQSGRTSIPFIRGLFYVIKVSVALLLDLMRSPWPKEKVGVK